MLLAISAICTIAWLTVGGLGVLWATINWLGILGLAVNGRSAVSTVGRLTVHGLAIGRGGVDRLAIAGLSIDGLGVARLSVDRLSVARSAIGRWLSIDGLAVDGLRTVRGWCSVGRLLGVRGCEAILSLSLGPAHLTEEANRSLLLGSSIVESTNEAEVHGLEQRMVVNIGTLTPFLALDVLLGRRPVVVGDRLVFMRTLLLLLTTVLIGLGKGSIDACSESFIRDAFRNCLVIATSKIVSWECTVHFCRSVVESSRDSITLICTACRNITGTHNGAEIELRISY